MPLWTAVLLAAAVVGSSPPSAAAVSRDLYRLDLVGNQTLWSQDRPQQSGALILFHRYPDGVLLSIRSTDVRRVVVSKYQAGSPRALSPGGLVQLGATGDGSRGATAGVGGTSASSASPAPGEGKDGKALLNPDRPYRPDWDSKQVPGMNLPYPNSPNDYREGRTLAFPPAAATQSEPGDLPRARVETGEPPRPPQQ